MVVATGSMIRRPPVPGADAAHTINTLADAVALDQAIARGCLARTPLVIAVVGAGFTGFELALELRDRVEAHGGEAAGDAARILLFDRRRELGAGFGPSLRTEIQAALAAARIELRLGTEIRALNAGAVELASGEEVSADLVVLTTGLMASSFGGEVPGSHDGLGRVIVDGCLKAPDAQGVFVAGDAALADTGDGHMSLQSCQHALQLGRFAGENAARDLLGRPCLVYQQPRYVTCLDLGRSGAAFTEGWSRRIAKTGDEGKRIKQMINRHMIYPPSGASAEMLLALSSTDPRKQDGVASTVRRRATATPERLRPDADHRSVHLARKEDTST